MEWYHILIIIYVVVINIIAIAVTVKDKEAARHKKWRISEKTLFVVAALSGCITMYLTMLAIHHKTQHKRFMIGIPVIFACEIFIAVAILEICR